MILSRKRTHVPAVEGMEVNLKIIPQRMSMLPLLLVPLRVGVDQCLVLSFEWSPQPEARCTCLAPTFFLTEPCPLLCCLFWGLGDPGGIEKALHFLFGELC